jgi:hypothetical protein
VIDTNGKPTSKWRASVTELPCTHIGLSEEARLAFNAYSKAMIRLVTEGKTAEHFSSCYGRYAEKALRIAMLLAAIDEQPMITLEHWAYAQRITERWREMLHEVVEIVERSQPLSKQEIVTQRAIRALTEHGPMSINDMRRSHVRGELSELTKAMESLVDAHMAGSVVKGKKTLFYMLSTSEVEVDEAVTI